MDAYDIKVVIQGCIKDASDQYSCSPVSVVVVEAPGVILTTIGQISLKRLLHPEVRVNKKVDDGTKQVPEGVSSPIFSATVKITEKQMEVIVPEEEVKNEGPVIPDGCNSVEGE